MPRRFRARRIPARAISATITRHALHDGRIIGLLYRPNG